MVIKYLISLIVIIRKDETVNLLTLKQSFFNYFTIIDTI